MNPVVQPVVSRRGTREVAPVWVVVCDAAKARTFEARPGDRALYPLDLAIHEESRKKASELVRDHSGSRSPEGKSAQGGSVHHNALAPRSSPKDVEKERFAHSLGRTLDHALRAARFERWILVAPPRFLGLMRKELTSELHKHLGATVDEDLTQLDAGALADRLAGVIVGSVSTAVELDET